MDSFDAFCLFLGKAALALAVFFVLATVGTLFTSWVITKVFGKDKVDSDTKMVERMVSLLSANEALLAEKKIAQEGDKK